MLRTSTSERAAELYCAGFVLIAGQFARCDQGWSEARLIVDKITDGERSVTVIGDFVIPPIGAPASRDFQTLHFDFGLPLVPVEPADVARFTALHIGAEVSGSHAVTRLVPLRALLAAWRWPDPDELLRRFVAYGRSHGAWDDRSGYSEGSLARIVEAALGGSPVLPSVKTTPEFLCGTEFASLGAELAFFSERGLPVEVVGLDISLGPGELLIFDNLRLAHGRRGIRQPGELNQRIFGHRALGVEHQIEIRDRVFDAFR